MGHAETGCQGCQPTRKQEDRQFVYLRVRFALALEDAAGKDVTILGPAPAPIALVRGRHRQHLLIKAAEGAALDRVREVLVRLAAERSRPRVAIDVDPVAML